MSDFVGCDGRLQHGKSEFVQIAKRKENLEWGLNNRIPFHSDMRVTSTSFVSNDSPRDLIILNTIGIEQAAKLLNVLRRASRFKCLYLCATTTLD